MTQSVDSLFESAIERYKAGEAPKELIPVFKDLCDRTPKSSASWTCLTWLYLLEDQPNSALKAGKKAVKLNPQDPQARVNLAAAMLETGETGVRQHIEIVQQIVALDGEIRQEIVTNIEDGLTRKPDWQSLIRIQNWLFGN
ncbi:tetratricopeptide repeat protein [Aerosakkonemataceae cyanobacterium BLCC-F154]|uniref:Tetratricopeptide repeat protein n=1 Tax=Floridaenema fluviatile BLCC-F154 TaxID=3153640 RepID=A0ABV4YD32_9CYAN